MVLGGWAVVDNEQPGEYTTRQSRTHANPGGGFFLNACECSSMKRLVRHTSRVQSRPVPTPRTTHFLPTKSLFTIPPAGEKKKKKPRPGRVECSWVCPFFVLIVHLSTNVLRLFFPPKMISHASLAKRPRRSYSASPLSFAVESFTAEEDLARQRFLSQSKLKSSWESIFAKYSKNFEGIADEIDQVTGEIVVDNGHVRGMAVSIAGGKDSPKRVKKPLLCDAMRLAVEKDIGEDVGCEACRFQDELDDSICLSCIPQRSPLLATPSTAVAEAVVNLTLDRVSAPASLARSRSTMTKSPLRNSPCASLADELMMGTPTPQVEHIPSDAFILKKLGNHGAAVVGLLAKARAQAVMSSPVPVFSQDDTPSKNIMGYIRGGRTEVEISPHRAKSPFFATAPPPAMATLTSQPNSPKISADQAGICTWSSTRVATWMLTNEVLHNVEDLDLVNTIKKYHVSGSAVDCITFDDLETKLGISSFGGRMKLWSGILKLREFVPSPLRQSQPQITSPLFNSMSIDSVTETKGANLWAPPPVHEDPFYSHIWGDEHPDGTPLKFPPRMAGPIFFKSETPASDVAVSGDEGAKKGVKRKRESLAGNTSGLVKVEAIVESPSAKKSVVRVLADSVSKSPKVVTKASDVKTPRPKTPTAKTPRTRSLVVKTPSSKPAIKTPTITKVTKATATKTPTTKTPTKNTPVKTPAKTPTLKTPTATKYSEESVPGWTTNSTNSKGIGRSFEFLTDDKAKNNKRAIYRNSGPTPVRPTRRVTSTRVVIKEESSDDSDDNDNDDGDDNGDDDSDSNYFDTITIKKEASSGSGAGMGGNDHVCTGEFCLVCVNLDGEEDDLV